MKKIMRTILKGTSSMAISMAVNSLAQASTIFTHQPKVDEELNNQLRSLK
ncbi:cyclic lactone autoinducer peptide [Anaerocolumna sp. AGMB13020]|nr:cyclic lactone autoinducer peptide [Anaerocolumna sp. AGMB13020]WOO38585.1 cyclic lactone autoinducer peptide [Anaerocolumna sp. AGMB13020]